MEPAANLAEELELLRCLLHWSGTMQDPRAGVWARRAYYMLGAATSAAIVLFLCSQGFSIWSEGTRDMERFLLKICTFNSIATWLFRRGNIAIHEHQFHYLSFQMDRDFREFLSLRDVPLLQKRCRVHRRFVLCCLVFGVMTCVIWILLTVAIYGFGPAGVPLIMALPYDISRLRTFIPTWFFASFIATYVSMMTAISDIFNVSIIAQLRFQLSVLSRNLIILTIDADTTKSPVPKEDYITTMRPYKSLEDRKIRHRLRQSIVHHQVIIRNTELFEKCIGDILLGQCFSIGASVSLMLFQVAMSAQSFMQVGKFSCYLSMMLMQLFMYCWFGDDLITESENVTQAAYTALTSVYGFPADVRKSLLIVMTRTQRPLRVTAGGLFPFCRELFVSIMNVSYSYFAILRNFKDD